MVTSLARDKSGRYFETGSSRVSLCSCARKSTAAAVNCLLIDPIGVLHLRGGFHWWGEPGHTICLQIGDLAVLDHGNRGAGHFGRGQNLVGSGVDAGFRVLRKRQRGGLDRS